MANFASLVCIQIEIEGIEVCHFHRELFLDLNNVYSHWVESQLGRGPNLQSIMHAAKAEGPLHTNDSKPPALMD